MSGSRGFFFGSCVLDGGFPIPGDPECSNYTDCECRWTKAQPKFSLKLSTIHILHPNQPQDPSLLTSQMPPEVQICTWKHTTAVSTSDKGLVVQEYITTNRNIVSSRVSLACAFSGLTFVISVIKVKILTVLGFMILLLVFFWWCVCESRSLPATQKDLKFTLLLL